MHFERFYDNVLAHVSYLVGDETSGVCAVIDPRRDVDVYLDSARARGLKIRHAILTRTSSSFATGHIELRDRAGAEIVISRRADVEYAARLVGDGDEISLGPDVRLTFVEAPGTSEDGLACVVQDRARGPSPCCVFTGDTLPVDAIPCVDIAALDGRSAEECAVELHGTLQRKLLALPDATRVFPARGTAAWTTRPAAPPTIATLGQQRATNAALRLSLKAFVPVSLQASQVPRPTYAAHVLETNRKERPSLDQILEDVLPLEVGVVLAAIEKGSVLVDARSALDYLLAHPRGSLAVPLDARFGPWVAHLVPPPRPIVLLPPEGRALEAAIALARIGVDSVWGYVRGGITALRLAHPELVVRTPALSPIELSMKRGARVVDVRSSGEREARRIPGAFHVPLEDVSQRAVPELPRGELIVLASERGDRSATAASILERLGYERLAALMGGVAAWEDAGQPVERPVVPERRISA